MKNQKSESIVRGILLMSMFLLLFSSITACSREEKKQSEESEYWIYYIDSEETQVVSEPYKPKGTTTIDLIEEYLYQLDKNPKNITYKKAKPDNVTIKDYNLSEDGQLTLNFDANYKSLSGITEILCRAAIVKTLGQVEGVEYIEFYVNGQSLLNANEKPIVMTKNDFIDNTSGETNYTQEVTMTLYFTNKKGEALVDTRVKKIYDGTVSMEQLIIEQLIKGPSAIKGADEANLYPTIPDDTLLNKVTTKDGVCYVDLSDKFLDKLPDITEEVAIYSIVNSLAEMPSINRVKFLINGKEQKKYRETITFDDYFERNLDLVTNKQ